MTEHRSHPASEGVYLRPDTLIEPLINQWYAWTYLLSPATAAMFVANAHGKLMQSFVASPQVHASAARNPAMRGGAFLDVDPARASDVKALLERTVKAQPHMVEFAEALKALDRLLAEEGKGYSLEGLYTKVPEPLRGYVELVYDMRDSPSVRFLEGMLYESPYYQRSAQSLCFSRMEPDHRVFRLNTPRLLDPGDFLLHVPFETRALDDLYRMRRAPGSFEAIRAALGVQDADVEAFRSFFTEERPPERPRPSVTDGVRIRYFGHACVLIEAPGVSILFDPAVSYDFGAASANRFTVDDLPATIDYVVISHNHQDHVLFECLLELRHRIKNVLIPRGGGGLADPSLKLVLEHIGFDNVRELAELESVPVPGGSIRALPFFGEHADLDIRTKMVTSVKLGGHHVLMMADANNVEPRVWERVHQLVGDAELVFVGMECEGAPMSWLYGPLFTRPLIRKNDMSRRFDGSDFERAIKVVDQFQPRQVYVYAMGQEPWLGHVMGLIFTPESRPIIEATRLVDTCRARGITAERLHITKEIVL